MKVDVECAACFLHRGCREVKKATTDSSLQFRAISSLFDLLKREFRSTAVPAHLGTSRVRLISKITGNIDPYAKVKQTSNEMASAILPSLERLISTNLSSERRFRNACLCSTAGNVIEFGILGHTLKFEEIEKIVKEAERDVTIDDITKFFNLARKAKHILYLADNAGEIFFDKLLVRELKTLGAYVVVAVKGEPVLNDATLEDAKQAEMHEVADNVTTLGTGTVGLNREECSPDFLAFYNSADLVVAKGMGYAETITEYNLTSPHALLLRTKCQPVANFFNVAMNRNIVKLIF